MKIEEIRIGNLVQYNGWQPPKIVKIGVEHYISEGFWRDFNNGLFVGIPLTEEWYLKNGFVWGNNNGGMVLLKDRERGDYADDNVLYVSHHLNWPDSYVKYVHRLQNLYHAQTGTELPLSPT